MARPSDNPLLDVPLHTFIRVWQTSESISEVKERLGLEHIPNKLFSSRAAWLRKKQVNRLRKMKPQRTKKYPDDMINELSEYSEWLAWVQESESEDLYEDLSFETFQSLNGEKEDPF